MIIEGLSPGLLSPQNVQYKSQVPNSLSAYTSVYNFQTKVLEDDANGYLLILAPMLCEQRSSGQLYRALVMKLFMTSEIHMYIDFFTGNAMHICLVKKYKGPCTPILSSHSSRPSFDALKKQLQDEIRQAPANHQQAKDRALYRDGLSDDKKCLLFLSVLAYMVSLTNCNFGLRLRKLPIIMK
ncbi:HNH endonuclease [Lentinula edodes]|uniref:HNH endonuclease n=1 Tax=Lentinula edodes TaxID=5353 RepID=A0A1Q3EB66_LENED|nr:HNH endonuclease [Lentinula edodes]